MSSQRGRGLHITRSSSRAEHTEAPNRPFPGLVLKPRRPARPEAQSWVPGARALCAAPWLEMRSLGAVSIAL
eukprot:3185229-Alexandrium_andersonii.AAC.1